MLQAAVVGCFLHQDVVIHKVGVVARLCRERGQWGIGKEEEKSMDAGKKKIRDGIKEVFSANNYSPNSPIWGNLPGSTRAGLQPSLLSAIIRLILPTFIPSKPLSVRDFYRREFEGEAKKDERLAAVAQPNAARAAAVCPPAASALSSSSSSSSPFLPSPLPSPRQSHPSSVWAAGDLWTGCPRSETFTKIEYRFPVCFSAKSADGT
uniref:Uncharacterized protein n=1 Tax=Ananas comosus var. bracteatus TaxID=296719 RepID=A0A6V7NJ23_ANACO|nr:unnamed protein product [Ananas comosus var. bracteatus]